MSHRRREKSIETGEAYQLREPSISYGAHFGVKKGNIGPENTYFFKLVRA
jgi:hypothetical protein